MKQAFSLVELSIVLVILGLLTGGILTGQNLIRAAELRSVTTEHASYQTAMMSFRDKYFKLPGDLNIATDFWGATAAANGDADGLIEAASGSAAAGEMFGFWEHLALAGLIEGSYTGLSGSDADDADLAVNVPRSKLGNAGWSILSLGTIPITNTTYYEGNYGNAFFFGAQSTGNPTIGAVLSPEEAWNVDTKADDGKPALGSIKTLESLGAADGSGCTDKAAAATALASTTSYELANTAKECGLIFSNK